MRRRREKDDDDDSGGNGSGSSGGDDHMIREILCQSSRHYHHSYAENGAEGGTYPGACKRPVMPLRALLADPNFWIELNRKCAPRLHFQHSISWCPDHCISALMFWL